ncbi:MAG: serine/threonine-protein kinase [Kofleriaceae bacterium]
MADAGDRELARARALLAGDTFAGIDVLREAATGGMGRVFEGVELATKQRVAVKLLTAGTRTEPARFAAEAEILERLTSDCIVAYVAHGVAVGGEPYLVMEWLDGETLAHRLAAGPLALAEAVTIARRVASALACAHASGIVHRDVKPSNVFLPGGAAARAKLIDFGVARQAEADRQLTATGQLVGTPGYMAPEQAMGRRDLDGRADLFALGCLLFEMIYGEPPFRGGEVVEVLAKVLMHEPQPVSSDRRAPPPPRLASLMRALLVKEPEHRLASAELVGNELDAITNAITTDDAAALRLEPYRRAVAPRPRRWRVAAALIAAGAIGGGTWYATHRDDGAAPAAELCAGADAAFASAWSPARRQTLAAGLVASKAPKPDALADQLGTTLDQYAARWTAAHTEACRASVRGEQTESMLDLRMICLERRRQAVVALVDVLATADATTASRAASAGAGLPDVNDCSQIATLSQIVPPPSDPAARAKLDALAARLAAARVRYQTGAFDAALTEARTINEAARTLGYRPFEAEAGLLQGQLENRTGKTALAINTIQAAVWAAEAGRHDEVAARGWVTLLFLVGYEQGNHARVEELSQRASAAIARLGGNADIEASLEQGLGAIDASSGKLDLAIQHFEKAIPLLEKQFGPEHPNVSGARENLATALLERGDARGAVREMTKVLAMREKALPKGHALIGRALKNLGTAHAEAGEQALGEGELRRALVIMEATLGPEHPEIADLLINLSRTVPAATGLPLARRAIAIMEKAFGRDNPALVPALLVLGTQLVDTAADREAEATLARAEPIAAKDPETRGDLARVWLARGDLQLRHARWLQAIALYERALAIFDAGVGTYATKSRALTHLGLAQLELHRPKLAIASLERARIGARDLLSPGDRGAQDFALARALWDGGGDRARAAQLASRAAIELAGKPEVTTVEAWRAAHRLPD